ncbi:hypothetical protein C5S31_09830 [ANME-1 cluster archaeon GoMg2]|nr:hypothetical protein [ANME-1 cluster archaeon GoMg2]
MGPLLELVLIAITYSVAITIVYYIFYLAVVKGFTPPVQVFNYFKDRYMKHSRNTRVKEKMKEYETICGMHKPSVLGSTIVFSLLVLIISVLLFKLVFFAVVTTGSMSPTMERGDLILMQRIYIEPVEGDIIMLERKESMIPLTHRVFAVTDEGVRTKGDAYGTVDPWIASEEDIKGKALQIGTTPIVLRDVGDYFILDTSVMRVGRYGTEYAFLKNLFSTIRMYGYALCIIAILGYIFLTMRELKS